MFFGIGLHMLVAIYFAVHAVRHGHQLYWLIILLSIPYLGAAVYFFAIYLPELRGSRGAMVAKRAIVQAVDPGRELRAARRAFDMTPTVDNRARLAAALLDAGEAREAAEQYRACASGPFAGDAKFLSGLALASITAGDAAAARQALEQLFDKQADARRQPVPALIYARALAELRADGTREAFLQAVAVASDAEAKCRYADWLMTAGQQGDAAQAQAFYEEIVRDSRHWHSHAKNLNKEWLRRAQSQLGR